MPAVAMSRKRQTNAARAGAGGPGLPRRAVGWAILLLGSALTAFGFFEHTDADLILEQLYIDMMYGADDHFGEGADLSYADRTVPGQADRSAASARSRRESAGPAAPGKPANGGGSRPPVDGGGGVVPPDDGGGTTPPDGGGGGDDDGTVDPPDDEPPDDDPEPPPEPPPI